MNVQEAERPLLGLRVGAEAQGGRNLSVTPADFGFVLFTQKYIAVDIFAVFFLKYVKIYGGFHLIEK